MVVALISLFCSVLLGVLLSHRVAGAASFPRSGLRVLWLLGSGAALGIGVCSYVFFVFGVLLGSNAAALGVELAAIVWLGYTAARRRSSPASGEGSGRGSQLQIWICVGVLVALGAATTAVVLAGRANPYGNWDAWGLWNLRAKMLAAGHDVAPRAWSPILATTTHPEYPLLLSSFVAQCWAFGHSTSQAIPIVTSYIFFLALIAMVWGGAGLLRGPALGGLAALVLASTPSLLQQVPNQYADIPIACYFVGAILAVLLEYPVLAGAFAGFGAWTKDEGVWFLILLVAGVAVFQRKSIGRMIAAVIPAGLLIAWFKMAAARGEGSLLTSSIGGAAHRIADASRYVTIVQTFFREFWNMGASWYHPLLPVVVLAAVLRFDRGRRLEAGLCAALMTGLLAADFGAYLITSNNLNWQLDTSLNRLLLQAWPLFILAAVMILRAPEDLAIAPVLQEKPAHKTRQRAKR